MAKILGLDIGTNSIGWAIVDNSSNQIIALGAYVFPLSFNNERELARQQYRADNRFIQRTLALYRNSKRIRQSNPVILTLVFCLILTALLTIINLSNWQFWLNLSFTAFAATLSLFHQRKDK